MYNVTLSLNKILLFIFFAFAVVVVVVSVFCYKTLGGGTHALHGSTSPPPQAPPPSPASQPAFKFKRFGVQFHKKIALAALSFFLLRIFFGIH
jgi:hypothetical protein